MAIAIIVHGGAWNIPADDHVAHKAGCRTAAVSSTGHGESIIRVMLASYR